MRGAINGERGQASPEWLGLILVVALVVGGLAAAGLRLGGFDIGRAVVAQMRCAAGLGDGACGDGDSDLLLAYGPELAALIRGHAPEVRYEDGMRALPVDFRSCRADSCAEGAATGSVAASLSGEPATAFVRAVDCREGGADARQPACAGEPAGNAYVQYWLYYPGSQTLKKLLGDRGFHRDDFEGYQVRIGSDGRVDARATSHRGYNYDGGVGGWLSDLGWISRSGWGDDAGTYYVSGGSHAGRAHGDDDDLPSRWTPAADLRLIPLETLADQQGRWSFAISSPWKKDAYTDPEAEGTS